jgi:hypothetical protein
VNSMISTKEFRETLRMDQRAQGPRAGRRQGGGRRRSDDARERRGAEVGGVRKREMASYTQEGRPIS